MVSITIIITIIVTITNVFAIISIQLSPSSKRARADLATKSSTGQLWLAVCALGLFEPRLTQLNSTFSIILKIVQKFKKNPNYPR